MDSMKSFYWTPWAPHCINLMLEDISKMKIHKETLEQAKGVIQFIYNHSCVLSLMRSYIKRKELLRPVVTRFATSFLTLPRLYKLKQPLKNMFSSEKFIRGTWARKPNGVKAKGIVLYNRAFWVFFVVLF